MSQRRRTRRKQRVYQNVTGGSDAMLSDHSPTTRKRRRHPHGPQPQSTLCRNADTWPRATRQGKRNKTMNCTMSRGETRTDPQGGYPSGCRLIDGGSGPKSVGGSSRMELGNLGETRGTWRFILVQASGE
jgi:hypothetical protein